jgi:hypothetical protein
VVRISQPFRRPRDAPVMHGGRFHIRDAEEAVDRHRTGAVLTSVAVRRLREDRR